MDLLKCTDKQSEISMFDSIVINFLLSKSQQWQGVDYVLCIRPMEILPSSM